MKADDATSVLEPVGRYRVAQGVSPGWIALVALLLLATPAAAQIDGAPYACRPLAEALRDLQTRGLPVVFGSNLVREGMLVSKVPDADTPRRVLDQLLEPHGLRAQQGAGGRLLVVQSFTGPSSVPPWSRSSGEALPGPTNGKAGVLPVWVEASSPALTVIDIPRDATPAVPPTSRYLVLRLAPEQEVRDWAILAFDLKALVVDLKSRAKAAPEAQPEKALRIALDASPEATDRLLDHGLAPYLDAYAGGRIDRIPDADPTARRWWLPPADSRQPLHLLLEGAARGAELVILDRHLDPTHRAFLDRVQATPSVDLERQPPAEGLAADRVRFLYNLETGSYYLAAYAEPGRRQTLSFSLGSRVEARSLYPATATVPALHLDGRTEIELAGAQPFHLIELRPEEPKIENGLLEVDGEVIVDPYEVVVRNQVFQEREAKKVRSLDVMERRHSVSQTRSSRRYTWTHRIIERPGRLTEFHHLGVERNGVPFPERTLRVGRDFRAEAQVELDPLEIELDRTYRYAYLGEETVDGHGTWKIGFEPLQEGAFLQGTVWIDRRTHAHRKLHLAHVGLSGTLLSREVTRFYDWIPDDDQCFWNWSRSEGLSVIESPTSRVALAIDAERYGFDYNREDIEHEVQKAHASDVPIHVATPPDGHRWLLREEPKRQRRRLFGRLFHRRGHDAVPQSSHRDVAGALAEYRGEAPGAYPQSSGEAARLALASMPGTPDHLDAPSSGVLSAGEPYGGRVLAGRSANASIWDAFLIARENCSNTISCSGFGLDYRRTDLFKNRSELYASLYDIQTYTSFTYPRLQGSRWSMTASLLHDLAYWDNAVLHPGTTDVWAEFEERRTGLTVALARPIGSGLRLLPASGGTMRSPGAGGTLRARIRLGLYHLGLKPDSLAPTPGLVLPDSVYERLGAVELDFQHRKLYARAAFELRQRNDADPWGIDGSESLSRMPSRFTLTTGYSTALAGDRSLGSRVVIEKGWNLDHFSDFFSGFDGVRAPGFQPQRHDFGLGASVSWSGRLAPRLPVTLRLEGAVLRSERYPWDDADQLGVELETFLNAWLKTDLFLRFGYGLYSNIPDQDGDLRTRFIVSRKF